MRAGIALGSNLGDRLAHLQSAVRKLQQLTPDFPLLASRIYETEPIGTDSAAGPFLNAVVEIGWGQTPGDLLSALQHIEHSLGRPPRRERNASRTIDLDLLYAGDAQINEGELTVPHPRLHLRRFVLQPLSDIRPDLVLPCQSDSVVVLLQRLGDASRVEPIPATLLPLSAPKLFIP